MNSRQTDILVIGAGPAGITAAVMAARAGRSVILLDHADAPGKKILATGNGRCNFTNLDMKAGYYRSNSSISPGYKANASGSSAYADSNSSGNAAVSHVYCREDNISNFAAPALEQFSAQDTISFFRELGIWTTDKDGWCYPRSMQASAIRHALLAELERLSVVFICNTDIRSIRINRKKESPGRISKKISETHSDGDFERMTEVNSETDFKRNCKDCSGADFKVITSAGTFTARCVILAAGGCALPKSGSDGSGYALAAQLGHTCIPPVPALVPLVSDARWLKHVKGVRAKGQISLQISGRTQRERRQSQPASGELQFAEYGISGIPVFQVSRYAARALSEGMTVEAHLDLIPETDEKTLLRRLEEVLSSETCPKHAKDLLGGLIPGKLAAVLADRLHAKRTDLTQLSAKEKKDLAGRAASILKDIRLSITGTKDFDQAQVTAGGIQTAEVDPQTMESRIQPGFYLAGEILDIDGPCGGYNLQWAFSSGAAAGRAAAK